MSGPIQPASRANPCHNRAGNPLRGVRLGLSPPGLQGPPGMGGDARGSRPSGSPSAKTHPRSLGAAQAAARGSGWSAHTSARSHPLRGRTCGAQRASACTCAAARQEAVAGPSRGS
eukprot:scaffold2254_cov393-Prasinococcus_capsulatus_cf.AAC.21